MELAHKPCALIVGAGGQDGAYLTKLLLSKGYRVVGTSRDADASAFVNLKRLGVLEATEVASMAPGDFRSVLQVVSRVSPDEIYHLAGQTSVALSFEQPVEALESILTSTVNLLEVIRFLGGGIKLYNACSSECFGDTAGQSANETTHFHPLSPYAVAKAAAYWQVANYRAAYGMFASSGILFNHESPLRPERFVTRKVIAAAVRIARGSKERLVLGDLSVRRDWGWAEEFVEGMWRILQAPDPDDFVIATGESMSLEYFVEEAFRTVGLNWRDHVDTSSLYRRPTDIAVSCGDPEKAMRQLGWAATVKGAEVIRRLVKCELEGGLG